MQSLSLGLGLMCSVLLVIAGTIVTVFGILFMEFQPFGALMLFAGLVMLAFGIVIWRDVGRRVWQRGINAP